MRGGAAPPPVPASVGRCGFRVAAVYLRPTDTAFRCGETRKFQARGDTAFGFLVFVISGTDQADGKPISRI